METDFTEHKSNKIDYNRLFSEIIQKLSSYFQNENLPSVSKIKEEGASVFEILISTIISARTKDEVTYKVSRRLFSVANNPEKLSLLNEDQIASLIYPAGFYKVKAKNIKRTSQILYENYNSKVPEKMEELLKLPGVGRKTANLLLAVGFNKEGLCVDTHVHRISNRLGVVKTSSTYETEMALRLILPKSYWEIYNRLLVTFGQNICTPISPFCSKCVITRYCKRINVKKSR
ncbi:MAG: endonuclease III [Exilispira sp.]|nr:endonuclease III [Exilispira sp.]